jgi:UDP-N-acetylglucosamine diphosphorylase/glucosamine-1-phosphate N-acetyltransferase
VRFPDDAWERGALLFGRGGIPLGWLLPRGVPLPNSSELLDIAVGSHPEPMQTRLPVLDDDPRIQIAGERVFSSAMPRAYELSLPATLLLAPWEIPVSHAEQLRHDLGRLFPNGVGSAVNPLEESPGVHRMGDAPVSTGPDVVVDPGVVLDTRKGPIHLGARVRISPFTWLKGPSSIGPDSTLLGGTFDSVVCGPMCRLRGEIEESVILGYSNKAHDGYLGHAVLGRWVNLGAMTTNSDLKNNYGTIRIGGPHGETDTGLLKMGALLGDHVKLGIGTLLDAGTVVGVGSNVFGGGFSGAKWIPPFSWGGAKEFSPYDPESFLSTAETVMRRRGIEFPDGERAFLLRIWEHAHGGSGKT